MRRFVVPLAALALAGIASVNAAAAPLTLEDCARLALRNNLAVAQGIQNVESADADVMGSKSAFFPNVSVRGSYTRPENKIEVFQGGELKFFGETWSAGINASLLLFDGLGSWSGHKQAKRAQTSANHSLLDSRQEVVYRTAVQFFEVRRQEALMEVQAEAVNQSGEQLKKTQAMKDLGAATQADVYKAEVDHSNNRLTQLRTQRDLKVAKASLAEYIGLDPREELELTPDLLELRDDFELEEVSRKALEINPELLAAETLLESRKAGVGVAKSDRYPSLRLFGNADYFNFEPKDFDDEHIDWDYGVSLNLTVFDGFRTKSNIRRAEAQQLFSRRDLEVRKRRILLDVQRAYLDLEIALESIAVAEGAVRSSEEDLRLARERYKIGEGTILDVIDAQVNLTRSKTDLVSATHDRRLAIAALRNAIGDIRVPEEEFAE